MTREVKTRLYRPGDQFRYAHYKRDGHWLTLVAKEGVVNCLTRRPRNVTDTLRWHPVVQKLAAATRSWGTTRLFCEEFVEGGDREDVVAARRDEDPRLKIECFAVDCVDGVDYPEYEELLSVMRASEACGIPFVPFETKQLDPLDFTQLPPDVEGWMLKDGNMLNWMKAKPKVTYDLRVIGFTTAREGKTGKFKGLIGAMILADSSGQEVARCSGMTDAQRLHMTENTAEYVDHIVEVSAQGLGRAGGLMHPQFSRLRDDKTEPNTLGKDS